ncbi:MAG: transporter [Cyanobacteria bacterium HKST-UBA06]|nr:transporter [Cyanobacteria bacterium HKST-UBA06]
MTVQTPGLRLLVAMAAWGVLVSLLASSVVGSVVHAEDRQPDNTANTANTALGPVTLAAADAHQPKEQEQEQRLPDPVLPPLISTIRPSVSDTVDVVPQGSLQFSGGYTYANGPAGVRSHSAPEWLGRVGLGHQSEFRVIAPNLFWLDGAGTASNLDQTAFGDMQVGFSRHVDVVADRWALALQPALNLPVGGRAVTAGGGVNPVFRVVSTVLLGRRWTLTNQLETLLNPSGNRLPRAVLTPTANLNLNVTPRWGIYGEYAAVVPTDAGAGGSVGVAQHLLQVGSTWAVRRNQQLDARIGTGLNAASPGLFVGVGYAIRLDGLFSGR